MKFALCLVLTVRRIWKRFSNILPKQWIFYMKLNKYFIKFDKINSSIMMKLLITSSLGVAIFAGLLVACKPSSNHSESSEAANVEDVQASDIQVNPIDNSKEFPGAEFLFESI